MKEYEQIKAIAELDGWTSKEHWQPKEPPFTMWSKHGQIGHQWFHFKFLISRDAIIPVIEKFITNSEIEMKFNYALYALLPKREGSTHGMTYVMAVLSTPAQLCEALLKTLGKWED